MRDYQVKRSKYILPKEVYHQSLWLIRDYYRWLDECEEIDNARRGDINACIKSNYPNNILEQQYIRKERYLTQIEKIDAALNMIPEEYRKGVWDNIQKYKPFPADAHRVTYAKYKSKFIFFVAKKFILI